MLLALVLGATWPPDALNPFGEGTTGLSTFANTAEELGYDVRVSLLGPEGIVDLDQRATLLVRPLTGDAPSVDQARALLATTRAGGRVLVAGGVPGDPLPGLLGWAVDSPPLYRASVDRAGLGPVRLLWTIDDLTHESAAIKPTPLTPLNGDAGEGRPILSDDETFADLDRNGELDEQDLRGPFVVGFDLETEAGGRLIYLTSAVPLTNWAAERAGGESLFESLLLSTLPDGGTVVFDVGSTPRPALAAWTHEAADRAVEFVTCPACAAGAGLASTIGAAALTWSLAKRRDVWGHHETRLDLIARPGPAPDQAARSRGGRE